MRIQSILLGLFMQDEFIEQQMKKIEKSKDKKMSIYKVYDKKVLDELPEEYHKQLSCKIETHKMKIKMYFPQHFKQLRQMDSELVSIKKGFDLIENLKILSNIVETGDGGRSGELLFFNYDNSLLMKTISSQDIQSFRKIGLQYFDYVMNRNRNTLISKIYGMYSFTRKDTRDSKTYIVFMRNIANIPSNYVLRRYDLKGSRFDREVLIKHKINADDLPNHTNIELFQSKYKLINPQSLVRQLDINMDQDSIDQDDIDVVASCNIEKPKQQQSEEVGNAEQVEQKRTDSIPDWIAMYNQPLNKRDNSDLASSKAIKYQVNVSKIALKDLDFLKLEKQVQIEEDNIRRVKGILEQDSLFFKDNGLIDYSLLLFKVVKGDDTIDDEYRKQNNIFKSIREPNVYYHIGIIDYLQQWNIDKLLEQKAKQAIHANMNLNVSSQNPETYQSRFKQNIIDSFF